MCMLIVILQHLLNFYLQYNDQNSDPYIELFLRTRSSQANVLQILNASCLVE